MKKVSVDTHVLIWGVQRSAREHQKHKVDLATSLIEKLDKSGAVMMLSSIVVGEFLNGITTVKQREKVLSLLSDYFQIIDHNARSAQFASKVFQSSRGNGIHDELKDTPDIARQKTMVDYHIVGSLLSHDIDVFYCEDKGLRKIANEFLTTLEMPARQGRLSL